jgi:hypothetical protein
MPAIPGFFLSSTERGADGLTRSDPQRLLAAIGNAGARIEHEDS